MAKKLAVIVSRTLISLVLSWAAIAKLSDPSYTHIAIYQYQIASWETAELIAAYLPWVELVTALGIWIPRIRLGACTLSAILTVIFLAALISAIARELDITCGCFGARDSGAMLAPRLIQDFFLLVMSLFLIKEDAASLDAQLHLSATTDN